MAVTARISESGHVMVPPEIRDQLGLKPGDALVWSVGPHGEVTIRRVKYTLEELDGILGPLPQDMTVNELIEEAVHEGAERRFRRSRGEEE